MKEASILLGIAYGLRGRACLAMFLGSVQQHICLWGIPGSSVEILSFVPAAWSLEHSSEVLPFLSAPVTEGLVQSRTTSCPGYFFLFHPAVISHYHFPFHSTELYLLSCLFFFLTEHPISPETQPEELKLASVLPQCTC